MKNKKKEELQRLLWMANVQGFYPDKSAVELDAGYQRWLGYRQKFVELEQEFCDNGFPDGSLNHKLAHLSAGILFTFHYGPYRLLPRYLVSAGCRLTILISATVLDRERKKYAHDLAAMGFSADRLECLNASDSMVLRKMLKAISDKRLILVFLDANESAGRSDSKEEQGRLRVLFGGSYFYWRSNLLKLAHRFGFPVYAMHLSPKLLDGRQTWQMAEPCRILTSADKGNPMALLNAFSQLQDIFQDMMRNDWTAWENWGLMHHYKGFDERRGLDIRSEGGWMVPFSFANKGYLFDLSRKLFYEIIVKKGDIV